MTALLSFVWQMAGRHAAHAAQREVDREYVDAIMRSLAGNRPRTESAKRVLPA